MTTFYVLKILSTEQEFAYTTVAALCKEQPYEIRKVSQKHLSRTLYKNGYFKNKYIEVKRYKAKKSSDISV